MSDMPDDIKKADDLVVQIASAYRGGKSEVNALANALIVMDAKLSGFYDPPYRERRAQAAAYFTKAYHMPDDWDYLQSTYATCLFFMKAINDLMVRKNWKEPMKTIVTEDFIGDAQGNKTVGGLSE